MKPKLLFGVHGSVTHSRKSFYYCETIFYHKYQMNPLNIFIRGVIDTNTTRLPSKVFASCIDLADGFTGPEFIAVCNYLALKYPSLAVDAHSCAYFRAEDSFNSAEIQASGRLLRAFHPPAAVAAAATMADHARADFDHDLQNEIDSATRRNATAALCEAVAGRGVAALDAGDPVQALRLFTLARDYAASESAVAQVALLCARAASLCLLSQPLPAPFPDSDAAVRAVCRAAARTSLSSSGLGPRARTTSVACGVAALACASVQRVQEGYAFAAVSVVEHSRLEQRMREDAKMDNVYQRLEEEMDTFMIPPLPNDDTDSFLVSGDTVATQLGRVHGCAPVRTVATVFYAAAIVLGRAGLQPAAAAARAYTLGGAVPPPGLLRVSFDSSVAAAHASLPPRVRAAVDGGDVDLALLACADHLSLNPWTGDGFAEAVLACESESVEVPLPKVL